MSERHKKAQNQSSFMWTIPFGLVAVVFVVAYVLRGTNVAILNPKGQIAQQEHGLIVFTLAVLLAVTIPTILVMFFIVWKYRESNPKAPQKPAVRHNKFLVMSIWLFPTAIMLILATVMVPATRRLVPQRAISNSNEPMTIEVISLRWKWLFIYPAQRVASLNFVQLPLNTPVTFEMTADETPMSSFWIPNLGGQLYSMTSHVNRLNLMATTAGDYPGSSAEINGAGFAGMKFTARASSTDDFNSWVQSVQQSSDGLDSATYQKLLVPSEYNQSVFYSTIDPNLYASVISKYEGPEGHTH